VGGSSFAGALLTARPHRVPSRLVRDVGAVVILVEGSLVEPADKMEEKLTANLGEREIAEFVEDHEVEAQDSRRAAPGGRRGLRPRAD